MGSQLTTWEGPRICDSPCGEVVMVTPTIASKMLTYRHPNQRKLSEREVRIKAGLMREGRFVSSDGDAIKFDRKGFLVDGQHRLSALISAGVSLPFHVHYGASDRAIFDAIDQGLRRDRQTRLIMEGRLKDVKLDGVLVRVYNFDHRRFSMGMRSSAAGNSREYFDNEVCQSFYEASAKNTELCDWALALGRRLASNRVTRLRLFKSVAMAGTVAFILGRVNSGAEQFLNELHDGRQTTANDPLVALRGILMRMFQDKNRNIFSDAVRFSIRAFNEYAVGNELTTQSLWRTPNTPEYLRVTRTLIDPETMENVNTTEIRPEAFFTDYRNHVKWD